VGDHCPVLLGTVSSNTLFAAETRGGDDGKVYVFVGDYGLDGMVNQVWEADPGRPGKLTSTFAGAMSNQGYILCVMGGQMFWTSVNGVGSCPLGTDCTSVTAVLPASAGVDHTGYRPAACDPANAEIVWVSGAGAGGFTLNRASMTGANLRVVGSVSFPSDGADWGIVGFASDPNSIFYTRTDFTAGSQALYQVATNVPGAAGVLLANLNGSVFRILTNGALALVEKGLFVLDPGLGGYETSTTVDVATVPLPGGIGSGTAPVIASATMTGVIDQTTFYGTVGSTPGATPRAIVRCPLSDCSAPAVLYQVSAGNFADDGTNIYWTTAPATGGSGFSVWKAAK
jgi:hypothetical protein